MAEKSFYLVKRADRLTVDHSGRKRPTYYVRFRDAQGALLPWRSTRETTKTAAENWALGKLGKARKRREAMTLEA